MGNARIRKRIASFLRIATYVAALMVFCQVSAWASVSHVADGHAASTFPTNVTQLDATATVGSGECLIAYLHTNVNTVSATGVVWDQGGVNEALTSRGSIDGGTAGRIEVFVIHNPTAGAAKTLRATWTTGSNAVLGWATWSGADTSTCINTADTATNSGSSAGATVTVTSTTDGATFAAMTETAGNIAATSSQTELFIDNGNAAASAESYHIGGTSNQHDWDQSGTPGDAFAAIGVHVIAAAAGGGTTPKGTSMSLTGAGR